MTAYAPVIIRAAIKSLLLGEIGTVRKVPTGALMYGTYEGQPTGATRARANDPSIGSRFDVKVGAQRMHGATPISAKAASKLTTVPVTIDITTRFKAAPAEAERDEQRSAADERAMLALQALQYPGNLSLDASGRATGIVSGMLVGPEGQGHPTWEVITEDWRTLHHVSRISGAVVVVVDQPVSATP